LFSKDECLAVFDKREQELKAQYVLYVHFKFSEWKRFFGLLIVLFNSNLRNAAFRLSVFLLRSVRFLSVS